MKKLNTFTTFLLLFVMISLTGQTRLGNYIYGDATWDRSGHGGSMSKDGNRIAIGGYWNDAGGTDAGNVKIYELNTGAWTQVGGNINGQQAQEIFGWTVALNADGKRVVSGGPSGGFSNNGVVRIYEENGGVWTQVGNDIYGDDNFDQLGYSVSINNNGDRVAIGITSGSTQNNGTGGEVKVFEENGGIWTQVGSDMSVPNSNDFGTSIAMNASGNRIIVGDEDLMTTGGAVVFEEIGGVWTQIGSFMGDNDYDRAGYSVSMNAAGNIVAVGIPHHLNEGRVRIYQYSSGSWSQLNGDITLGTTSAVTFGNSISLNDTGNRIAIGDYGNKTNGPVSGQVNLYQVGGGTWNKIGNSVNGAYLGVWHGSIVSLNGLGTRVFMTSSLYSQGALTKNGRGEVWDYVTLPVELVSFNGFYNGKDVLLDWVTAWEQNNKGFHIEHSTNGIQFESIEFIEGKGTTSTDNRYTFIHANPKNGSHYYRLKQIDYDGSIEYSKIIMVQILPKVEITFYPNPIKDVLNISTTHPSGIIQISNARGKTIQNYSWHGGIIDTSQLPLGMYFVSFITTDGQTYTKKVVKQ